MSLYKQFEVNTDVEKAGIFLEYGQNSKGQPIKIRVARAGGSNTKFARVLEAKARPYRRLIQNETLDRNLERKLFIEVYAESVILGWEGVEAKDGTPLPYSQENVIKLFTDLPELFDDVREQAQKLAWFRTNLQESDSGN